MKDLWTGSTLLREQTKNGVYAWSTFATNSNPLIAFASIKALASEWQIDLVILHLNSYVVYFIQFIFLYHLTVSPPSIATLVLIIKCKNFHYSSPLCLMSFLSNLCILMYRGPLWIPCMGMNIMWSLLTTLQSIYGFIYLKRNFSLGHIYLVQSFSWFFFFLILQLYIFTRMDESTLPYQIFLHKMAYLT